MGRDAFARPPHSRPSHMRPRGAHRAAEGRYIEADGITWTDAEPPVATRTDAPLSLADLLHIPPDEPMFTYDALQTADHGRLRQLHRTYVPFSVLIDTKYEEEAPPSAQELYITLTDRATNSTSRSTSVPARPYPTRFRRYDWQPGVPPLHLIRVTLTESDKPLALEEFHLPGDELELSFHL
ncbi:GntR family transcriptional regulator [Streptomyces olivaceoviridis]